jgi:hypothetical protein
LRNISLTTNPSPSCIGETLFVFAGWILQTICDGFAGCISRLVSTCGHLSQIERIFGGPILGTQQNKLLPTENVSYVDTPIHIITSAFLLAHCEHLGSWPRNDELLFLCVR